MCSFFLALWIASSTVASGSVITLHPRVDLTGTDPEYTPQPFYLKVTTPPTTEWACRNDAVYQKEICSQNFEMDLSTASQLKFSVEAPDSGSLIQITGPENTKFEFSARTDCPNDVQDKFQEIQGSTFTPTATGGTGMAGLKYNAEQSFVLLGRCDGCADCQIFTRLQFDGPVDAQFHTVSWEVPVDAHVPASTYTYDTNGYAWIRSPMPYDHDGASGIEVIKTTTGVASGAKSIMLKPWVALLTVASAVGAVL